MTMVANAGLAMVTAAGAAGVSAALHMSPRVATSGTRAVQCMATRRIALANVSQLCQNRFMITEATDWTPVPGYEGFYEASREIHAVQSLDRVIVDCLGVERHYRGKRMYPTSRQGSIVLSRDGHQLATTVDVVVARTFSRVPAAVA